MDEARWQSLIEALRDIDDVDRAVDACLALAEEADEEDLPRLYDLIDSDDFFIRECAADPLARLAGPEALPYLLDAQIRGWQEGHDNDGIHTILLGFIQTYPAESETMLRDFFDSQKPDERRAAACGWDWLEKHVSPEPLLAALNDPSPHVRATAAGSLGSFDGHPEVIEALIPKLQDPDRQVRVSTASALGYLKNPQAIPALKNALKDPSMRVRSFAEEALKKLTAAQD
jgi:HEAT repeat protein